ncbi:MAG: manganese efflux pump MntP family protein [Candidatus Aureabacteria bacterium]|nr:manganese efflux pump MntP family protein [Candidatus Auribacterota bacterium]
MSFAVLFFMAVALAMDCFAVSLAIALAVGKPSNHQTFKLAFNFGLYQFLMPVLGWFAGRGLLEYIQGFDHWVAFGLLAFIGGKMIYESTVIGRGEVGGDDPTRGISLIMLSLATSIDALGVGLSLSVLGVEILYPAMVIGIVSFVLTCVGMKIGPLAGRLFGKRVEAAGGIVLILIGIKILCEHFLS